ncbi:MAG: 50S ribosomal protein L24 [Patescibacteria group bacterium]
MSKRQATSIKYQKSKILKGDKVLVIAGKDRHKTGTVERVIPKNNRVVVTGINIVKKHLKRSTNNPQGGIIDKTLSIDISNVMIIDAKSGKPSRVGYSNMAGSQKQRIAKRSGEAIKKESK